MLFLQSSERDNYSMQPSLDQCDSFRHCLVLSNQAVTYDEEMLHFIPQISTYDKILCTG